MAIPHDLEMDICMTTEAPTRAAMLDWCDRYPRYWVEIMDLFAWLHVDSLMPEPDYDRPLSADERAMCDRITERTMQRIREIDTERRAVTE